MQKSRRSGTSKKPQYRAEVGNSGKVLVMEPPAPDPQSIVPETVSPKTVTVGVQYEQSPLDASSACASCNSPPLPPPRSSSSNGKSLDVFDSPDQTLLPHPLQPSKIAHPLAMDDSVTTTEEYDMADGLGKPGASSASSDSLNSNRSAELKVGVLEDRESVDLADMPITATNGEVGIGRGISEASDSGFSRSCCSDSPEKDSESGASDKFESGSVFETAPAPPPPEPQQPDEGIDLEAVNGRIEPPPTPNDVTATAELPGDQFFPSDQRRNSEASLNESISSSLSSGGHENSSPAAKPKPKGAIKKPNTKATKPAARKSRFSHVSSRIDSGRQSGLKSPTNNNNKGSFEEENAEEEGMKEEAEKEATPAPVKKRVHFQNCDSDKEEEHDGDAEDEFVIHPGPGFDDANGNGEGQRVSNFQEPRSLVKQYIRGRSGGVRPRIIKQTTVEVAELARRPQKAIPIPQASASGAAPNIPVKQTIASKRRLQKLQQESQAQLEKLQADSAYMTPLQRKEALVKELRRQLGEAYYVIEQREMELDVFHHEKQREIQDVVDEKDDLIKELEDSVEILQDELDATKADNNCVNERVEQLEGTIKELKEDAQKRELRHQGLYLQMYRKGRDSALFERQDELEKLAIEEPDKVSKDELLQKLSATQMELEHWQRVKLTEHYVEAVKPETEADAKLKFLKDSMFHYLTELKKDSTDQHLNAIIQIFEFTEVQMKSVNKALEEKRRRGKM